MLEVLARRLCCAGPPRSKLKGGDFDCIDIPDAAMTLAVVGAMATAPVKIRNVGSWRVKETERMKAIVTELEKLGVKVSQCCPLQNEASLIMRCTVTTEGTKLLPAWLLVPVDL